MDFKPTEYLLENCLTHRQFKDTGWLMADPQDTTGAFVRAVYGKKQIDIKDRSCGIYRFADWLPIIRTLKGSCAPFTYKSDGLAKKLGLENLYVTFSGYWPEKGVSMNTCSFKETEAYSVCGRLPEDYNKILVVASAGNTARAFAQVCSENNIPIVISIPEENMKAMWFKKPLNSCVKIICSPTGSDYFDAIALGNKLSDSPHYMQEGGAKNVARRDGMGTTVLSAAEVIGRIPDVYFQAVGSGTGAIAAYEANLRLFEDGRFGKKLMRLIPSQNEPFTPMYDAWKADSRTLLPFDEDEERKKALQIVATVLSNRKPPYSVVGGLYDALKATNGSFEKVTNDEVREACAMFKECEGIDIYSAAGVAVKSLQKAVASSEVKRDETIMLNITGGGEQRFKSDNDYITATPDLVISPEEDSATVISKVDSLFGI